MNTIKSFIIRITINSCIAILLLSCNDAKKNENIENQDWAASLIEAYRALNEKHNVASADLLFKATNHMPTKNWENYLVTATIYAPNNKIDKAFYAIEKALETGLRDSKLLQSLPELSILHNDSRWEILVSKVKNKENTYIKSIKNKSLLQHLEKMWMLDQQALSEYEQNIKLLDSTATSEDYSRLFKPVENRWKINKQKLDSIINIHGWPGYKLVGEDGAKISWAIPQHDPDVFFKMKCLSLLKKSVEEGDNDPNHYAELYDRIARDTWQKQTYGASMSTHAPHPIKDPSNVNKRRLELGLLEPIELYAYYHGITYQKPSTEEAKLASNAEKDRAQKNYEEFRLLISEKESDSANVYIRKAIKSYGNISSKQLYQASLSLAQANNKQSKELSIKIIKVLIWRKWENRYDIINNNQLAPIHDNPEWNTITELLQNSN